MSGIARHARNISKDLLSIVKNDALLTSSASFRKQYRLKNINHIKNNHIKNLKRPIPIQIFITSLFQAGDESYHEPNSPDYVIFPTSTEQISEIHKYCFKNEIGIIPYGQGSGFEGGVINTNVDGRPTVTLDMMKNMTQVLGVHGAPDRYAKVQAGVQRELQFCHKNRLLL